MGVGVKVHPGQVCKRGGGGSGKGASTGRGKGPGQVWRGEEGVEVQVRCVRVRGKGPGQVWRGEE